MAARKRKRKKDQAPGWAWMLFGLSLGLGVALVVYLKSPAPGSGALRIPFASAGGSATRPEPGGAPPDRAAAGNTGADGSSGDSSAPASDASSSSPSAGSATAQRAPADTATETDAAPEQTVSNELEFYELLQELGVNIPETERKADRSAMSPGAYKIQAGSFRTADEADSRKARLALLGIESGIESAIVNDQIWHRVIIGPLSDVAEINQVRRKLRDERIDALAPQLVSD